MTSSSTSAGNEALILKRSASDGTMIGFMIGSEFEGNISSNSSGTSYNTSSDYRLKENVIEMTGAIDRVNQLQPMRFNFISDPSKNIVDGFLAHQVSDICPQAVTGEKDAMKINRETGVEEPDYQGIDQAKLVPLLVGAVQELNAKNDALQTELTELKSLLQSKGLLD